MIGNSNTIRWASPSDAGQMTSQKSGYLFAIAAFLIFASQDAISKHLAASYHPMMITFVRFWPFAAFAIFMAWRAPGGIRMALRTKHPFL